MMDMIERRMSMFMRESEEDEDMKWETLIDYTVEEELDVTDTYHDAIDIEATFFQKIEDAKKIIIAVEFKEPSIKTQDALGHVKIGAYSSQGWFPFVFTDGNYLPNLTSGYASQSAYYKEIDLTSVCKLEHDDLFVVYAPAIFQLKQNNPIKKEEFFGYGKQYKGTAVLRLINEKVPIGKGSRLRVLVAS